MEKNNKLQIYGLLSIAISTVILYQTGITVLGQQPLEGGFIGFDIFFVVSGYLVTSIILKELLMTGSFSFKYFYESRIRQIFPVLLLVILTSLPFAYYYLLPTDLISFSKSIIAVLSFSSNFYFHYADASGELGFLSKHFIHTWLLSVIGQFYILFPIVLLIIFKYFRKYLIHILIIGFVVSLGLADWGSRNYPSFNFYVLPTRGWELLAGSILAYFEINNGHKSKNKTLNLILPTIGLLLIGYSILFFNDDMYHPSIYTLSPIIGVCLIIWFSNKHELVGKILGSKPLVWVGLISYSTYLWHFPIFVFSRMGKELTNFDKFEWIVLTIILSVLTYYLVEKPLRKRKIVSDKILYIIILICISVAVCLSITTKEREGFPDRFGGWRNYELNNRILTQGFWKYFEDNKQSLLTPSQTKVNVYIFGNSHSGDFLGALFSKRKFYEKYHFLKVDKQEQLSCFDERDDRFLKNRNALYMSDAYKKSDIFVIATRFGVNARCNTKLKDNPTDADGLSFLIPKLKKDGKKVVILGNTLVLDKVEGKWLEEKVFWDAFEDKINFRSFELYKKYKLIAEKKAYGLQNKSNLITNEQIKEFSVKNQLIYFDRRSLFCDDKTQRCLVFDSDGFRLRYDYGHLTLKGKIVFGELLRNSSFEKVLSEVVQKQGVMKTEFFPFEGSLP